MKFFCYLFGVIIVLIGIFLVYNIRQRKIQLIHKLYFTVAILLSVWLLVLMALSFVQTDIVWEYVIDSMTHVAVFIPPLMLMVALTLIHNWTKLPKWVWLLFVIPVITFIMVWTNPLHHWYYTHFSINASEISFGWYFPIHGIYLYAVMLSAVIVMARALIYNHSKLFIRQALLFIIGGLIPIIVNLMVTLKVFGHDIGIYLTPLANILGLVIVHGIAIYRFHLLDITPIAVQLILDRVSDCYLVLNSNLNVVSFNKAFENTFGKIYHIDMYSVLNNKHIFYDSQDNVGYYTLCSSIESCRKAGVTISYEHSLELDPTKTAEKRYYMVDVSPVNDGQTPLGFTILFKDITTLKRNLQKLESSQKRLMEQERLAFLGQMMGGISHNLKTPIMSISGGASAINLLIDECTQSMENPQVTQSDYREIYTEMKTWTGRIREACSYMSDIIFAVRGQTINIADSESVPFTLEDLFKRINLLMRHELQINRCTLNVEYEIDAQTKIQGEINAMVQILNNLIGNAVDSMKPKGGEIDVVIKKNETDCLIEVMDRGLGIAENVKRTLFHQMVTTKGMKGSGLGLFVSQSSLKAKFDGKMEFTDREGGGTIFRIKIPLTGIVQ